MTIDISNNDPRISYSVAQGVTQTSFAIPFEFFDDSDVNVYVDGTLKTITTDYTISGGNGSTGTVSISVTGQTGGSVVVLTRDITIERTTDFTAGADINRAALNTQLDTLTAIAADVKDRANLALSYNDRTVGVTTELPDVANLKGKTLAFNASTGAPEAGPTIGEVSNAQTYATNAAASAATAASSASAAAGSASSASSSASAAASSAASAAAILDSFDDIYLGAKASDPTVDNDGDPLNVGDQYFNTVDNELRIYNGTNWQTASTVGGTVTSLNVINDLTVDTNTLFVDSVYNFVGLGTVSPSHKLHVSGSDTVARLQSSTSDVFLNLTNTAGSGFVGFQNANLTFSTSGEKMRITSTGRVGINNTVPEAPLHVSSSSSEQALFESLSSTTAYIGIRNSTGSRVYLRNNANTFEVQTAGSSYSTKLAITSAGLVGIGTTSPSTTLHVAGTITGERMTLDSSFAQLEIKSFTPRIILNDDSSGGAGADKFIIRSVDVQTDGDYEFVMNNDQTSSADSTVAKFYGNGDISFYGATNQLTWDASADSLKFPDNVKAVFGTDSDLEIYNNGSATYVVNSSNNSLIIAGSDLLLKTNDLGSNYFHGVEGGYTGIFSPTNINLTVGGSVKLQVTSTGADVTGTITSDGLILDNAGGINSDVTNLSLTVAGGNADTSGGNITLYGSGSGAGSRIRFRSDSTERMRIENNGDISFYEDTGTTPKFFWDASAEALGIGTSNPSRELHVVGNTRFEASGTTFVSSAMANTNGGTDEKNIDWLNNGANFSLRLLNDASNAARTAYNVTRSGYTPTIHRWSTAASGNPTERLRIEGNGNVLIGGTVSPASAIASLAIFNGTAPTASVTDGVVLYAEDVSASSELKVRDEAGNVTTLSPHNFELIPEGPSEEMAWSYYSERDGKRINVDMLKAIRLLEQITGEKLVHMA